MLSPVVKLNFISRRKRFQLNWTEYKFTIIVINIRKKMNILYQKGDATSPATEGNNIIAHVCNDIGGWGKGFVLAISAKWKEPEKYYRQWYKDGADTIGAKFELGQIQLVQTGNNIWVANMIGQRDIHTKNGVSPIRYDAIEQCLDKLSTKAKELDATVHMPRIGCGLAGGQWEEIEPLIIKTLSSNSISTYVYDFK